MTKHDPTIIRQDPPNKPKSGFCINCDNKHGCKSKSPPCVVEMRENEVKEESGKEYLIRQNKTGKCTECSFFRDCWNTEDYARLSE